MTSSRRDNARGQAGEVGKADGYQRLHSNAADLFPESLPEPVAAHHPHISTTGEAQRQRVIEMLRAGVKNTQDFRRAGIFQSPTRIFELRALGYDIPTIGRVTIYDDQGYPHHGVALYELLSEPQQEARREAGFISPRLALLLAAVPPLLAAVAAFIGRWPS